MSIRKTYASSADLSAGLLNAGENGSSSASTAIPGASGSSLKKSAGKAFDVLVVGELNIDLILDDLHGLPVMGKEVFAGKMAYTLGSSSAIFAANLSAMGVKVAFAGKTGLDDFGHKICRDLAAKKVNTEFIQKLPHMSTGITVAISKDEDRAMMTYPGAMAFLNGADITDAMLSRASHLHVSSIFLQTALKPDIADLFSRARSLGLTTSLDPQWDPSERWEIDAKALLPSVNLFLPNMSELLAMTGETSKEAALEQLKDYLQIMVVKDGKNGAYGWFNHKWTHQPAFLNQKVVDAIGAGDSFNAGFIAEFLKNRPLHKCLKKGALMGAISTTASGGTKAFEGFGAHQTIHPEKFNLISYEATA